MACASRRGRRPCRYVSAGADDSGDAERGRQLYYEHACYGCHGYNGETGARDLVGTDSPIVANEAAFIAFLRLRGELMPVFPSTAMPSYPSVALSDAEARDIFAYIRTFELDAPDIDDVPALEAIIESLVHASGRIVGPEFTAESERVGKYLRTRATDLFRAERAKTRRQGGLVVFAEQPVEDVGQRRVADWRLRGTGNACDVVASCIRCHQAAPRYCESGGTKGGAPDASDR